MIKAIILIFFSVFLLNYNLCAHVCNVHFIHVGYGDCILIDPGSDASRILIDAGYPKAGKKVYQYLKKRNLLPVKRFIITHPDPDHYGGLRYLIKKIRFETIYWNGHNDEDKKFQKLLKIIDKKNISLNTIKKNDRISLTPITELTCLHPATLNGSKNNNSLVLYLTHSQTSFLFTADVGPEVQQRLAREFPDKLGACAVVKLPHHGDILDSEFETAIANTRYPVIMVAENEYGLPSIQTVQFFGKRLLRSDYRIDIVIQSDGSSVHRLPPR
ncbi:MAG: MBL fold metallo-hydrolase [Elusimicrobia bacterium]|nr:MBL fold metallo-hydrolase [Elusimicrobiota bacterium]MBD3412296.1 MBL fold metallo-hydrolase [Elusimicrobiota bacterium]